jgi:beta-lactamase regulating signal transducer with metallopeptidase domain/tetratricopeptide (TPR) repeat protein
MITMAAIHTLTSFLDSIASVILATWLFRITLLTTLACMYLAVARRAQPALRHAVAVGALAAVVLLPTASRLLPDLNVPVLRAPVVSEAAKSDPVPFSFGVSSGSAPGKYKISNVHFVPLAGTTAKPAVTTARGLLQRAFSIARAAFVSGRNWIRFALVMWMLVGAALLLRLALAIASVSRIARRATLINDEFLRVDVERACRALGVTRWIDIAASREIAVPMVIGVARPRIVLPLAAQEWSPERMRVVLLHEVAHIRRRDCVFMLFAELVGAVLWFHPAVVRLSRDVRRESERACDDLVLATGVRGSDYAEHLVSIARLSARRDALSGAALAFAAHSTLEQRVASILATRPRVLNPRVIGTVAVAALVLFAVTAAVHPTHAAPRPAAVVEPAYAVIFGDTQAKPHKNAIKVEVPVVVPRTETRTTTSSSYAYSFDEQKQEKAREMTDANVTPYQIAGTGSDESDGESWYDRAHNYYAHKSFDKAGRAYENAARFGYESGKAFYNAGCSYALNGQTDAAISMLQNAVKEGFDDPEMYASDDDLNSLRGDDRFKKLVDQTMKSDKGQENLREARNQYQHLASSACTDEGNWNSVGVDLMRAGDYDRAVSAFDMAHKVGDDNDGLYNKACARSLQGRTSDALDVLEQAIQAGDVDVDHMRSDPDLTALHSDKRFEELAQLAANLDLSQSWKHDLKKWKGDEQARWAYVLPRYESTAREHRAMGRAWFNLGYVQLLAAQPQKGVDSFQKALELGFRNPTTLYNLACANARAGNKDIAFDFLEKAQAAGFDVGKSAPADNDLDALKADPRWKAMQQRWDSEEDQKNREKHKKKYD